MPLESARRSLATLATLRILPGNARAAPSSWIKLDLAHDSGNRSGRHKISDKRASGLAGRSRSQRATGLVRVAAVVAAIVGDIQTWRRLGGFALLGLGHGRVERSEGC
eukprot:8024313-Pyramimonas_sp.AAC.1